MDLKRADGRFVIAETDRDYFITVDGQRFQWPCRIVSGAIVRKLGHPPCGARLDAGRTFGCGGVGFSGAISHARARSY